MANKLYIAYRTDVTAEKMKSVCPDAEYLGTAVIDGYELAFVGEDHKGVATIRKNPKRQLSCVLWGLSIADETLLDINEELNNPYHKEIIAVEYNHHTENAYTYVINSDSLPGTPDPFYYKALLDAYSISSLPLGQVHIAMIESMSDDDAMKQQLTELLGNELGIN